VEKTPLYFVTFEYCHQDQKVDLCYIVKSLKSQNDLLEARFFTPKLFNISHRGLRRAFYNLYLKDAVGGFHRIDVIFLQGTRPSFTMYCRPLTAFPATGKMVCLRLLKVFFNLL